MTKCLFVDPKERRAAGSIHFEDIPLNQFQRTVKDEKKNYSKDDILHIWRDMRIIREFEGMLNLIKTRGEYEGIVYNHPGPAHLSLGQESAAVGQAYLLTTEDYIFGSHRSHGEILAKGLSAVRNMEKAKLENLMKTYFDGEIIRIVEKWGYKDTEDLGISFLLYGALAEIFAKKTGFNRGLGGSMHAFFTPFGIYPNNAIVGGSGDIAVGGALYKKVNRKPGIVVCNIGDGSLACGPVWEGMVLATMDQYYKLWEGDQQGGLPLVFNIFNNNYGMGGQTCGETMGYGTPARVGAAFANMNAEKVDGYNPLAVIDAYRRKKELLAKKKGPALLEVQTYRYSGHSPSDSESYRTKEEKDAWTDIDPIKVFAAQIVEAGVATQSEIDAIEQTILTRMKKTLTDVVNDEISPRMNLMQNPDIIADYMFSNQKAESMETGRTPDALMPKEESPRVKAIAGKERFYMKDGKPVSKNKLYQLRDGIFEAIIDRYYTDPTMISYGEDVRDWAGAFAVYRGLTEVIPYHRLFNSPIAEGAIVGSAAGYAMCGGRVVPELMYCDFLGRSGDEIFNQVPKWQAMSAGMIKMPLVLRMSIGSKYGAQHSQDWSALCCHMPGLKVVFPATPYDAKGLMNSALTGTDPVVYLESQRIYDVGEMFHEGGVPEGYYEVPIGEPDVKVIGKDLTILSIGATLYRVLDAVKILKEKYGVEAEVIDARTLVPFNYTPVVESIKKTGRIVVAGDACERNSFMRDLASNIAELAFDYLDAPPVVVGARNWITPAHELEDAFFPQPHWIVDAIHERILPLKGHVPQSNWTINERVRNCKRGV